MWRVEDITPIAVELDFSSSGQGRSAATAVAAGGVRIFNAIEFVDVNADATQVEVCECCGFPHCSAGGWVTFRRIGENVVWIPVWKEMEKGTWEMSEYGPPSFLRKRGVPLFSPGCWERLRSLHGVLPDLIKLPRVSSREAARICQWSAPGRVLGKYPSEPRLRREMLITVTAGELTAEADLVDRCLRRHYESANPMDLVPKQVAMAPIEFWLELPGTPGWTSFAHLEGDDCLLIDGVIALVPEAGLIC